VNKPPNYVEYTMSKKPEKATLTSATIEEQTAAFLKAGGTVEQIGKGESGQLSYSASKQANQKK
jgi:alpha-tubulin suppressor-like RCC1 family protein